MREILANPTSASLCLHRHPRESGDPYDVYYPMDTRFREDDDVEKNFTSLIILCYGSFLGCFSI